MSTMVPVDDHFVELVAKAIAHSRLLREANDLLKSTIGVDVAQTGITEDRFTAEFDKLWTGTDDECTWNREEYTADAKTAINKINFLLLTLVE